MAERRAGVLVFFADQFDIYLPVIVLASVGVYFQPAGLSSTTSGVLTAFVFAAVLVTRPIGAAIFGHLADTTGRKRATMSALAGFAATTLVIAVLPGADRVGIWSIVALIVLRSVSGVFAGGAYTAAIPLIMERTPAPRRGVAAGLLLAASPLAYACLGVLTIVLHQLLPGVDPGSAYAQWGWRVPFLVGAALAVVALLRYRRSVVEYTPLPAGSRGASPLRQLLSGPHRAALMQVLVLMSGASLANNMTSAVLPSLLGSRVGMTPTGVAVVMTVQALLVAASFPLYGRLSQRVGRRPFYLGYGVVMVALGSVAYGVLMLSRPSLPLALVLTALVGLTTVGTYGPAAAYLSERFPAAVRATGFGVGYSLAVVVPGFYAFYLAGLSQWMPSYMAPCVLVAMAGVFVWVGAALGPETRDADLGVPAFQPSSA